MRRSMEQDRQATWSGNIKQHGIRRILTTFAAIGVAAAGTVSAQAWLFYGIPC